LREITKTHCSEDSKDEIEAHNLKGKKERSRIVARHEKDFSIPHAVL
jgi:hypothetical protein